MERIAAADIPEPSAEPCGTCKKAKRGITWASQVIVQLLLLKNLLSIAMHLFISQAVDVVNVMNGLDNGSWLQVEGCESSEEEHSLPAPAVAVAEKPKRGGRKKLALAEVEEEVADKVEEEAAAAPEVLAEAPVKRAGRRKAAAPLEEEVAAVAPSPIKRGRRGAASVQKEEEEVKAKSPVKRGKKAAIEKTAVAEEIRFGMKQHQPVI